MYEYKLEFFFINKFSDDWGAGPGILNLFTGMRLCEIANLNSVLDATSTLTIGTKYWLRSVSSTLWNNNGCRHCCQRCINLLMWVRKICQFLYSLRLLSHFLVLKTGIRGELPGLRHYSFMSSGLRLHGRFNPSYFAFLR